MKSGLRISFFLCFTTVLAACSNSGFKVSKKSPDKAFVGDRKIAYDNSSLDRLSVVDPAYYEELASEASRKGHRLEFPEGFSEEEKSLMWHMSEGSEIFPTLWMLNMRSSQSILPGTMFLEQLDKKFGVIPDYINQHAKSDIGYPMTWIGLTAGWSEEHPETQDIFLKGSEQLKDLPKVRKLKSGATSIAMSGVNCTFCHTGYVEYKKDDKHYSAVIEGAPAMIDARGFFKDMFASILQTMISEDKLTDFLERLEVKDAKKIGVSFSDEFRSALGLQPTLKSEVAKLLEKSALVGDKVKAKKAIAVQKIVFEKREVIQEYFIKLLKITHGLDKVSPTMVLRMKYFSSMGTPNPALEETPSGYGRTDAFGRISNEVAREFNPIPLTAPVSMPYMYGIKYKAMFHYNANTNSVISRNIGQSFGLGAILTNPHGSGEEKFASTSSLHNLITMEKILYKAKVPEFQEIFPKVQINKITAVKGCNIYRNKCMSCHEAKDERVGPAKALVDYHVLPTKVVGTDEIYLKNQATPIKGKPFRKGLFDFTDSVKSWYFKEYDVSSDEVSHWANSDIRGIEIFRDTVNGEDRFKDDPVMNYVSIEAGRGYVAKSLAGIWATGPFLHNGSVSSVYELLKPSAKRQKLFVVGSRVLDNEHMGFRSDVKVHPKATGRSVASLEKLCEFDATNCFDIARKGNSNKGHEPSMYGGELRHEEKLQLIEFLKVVRPESEYAWTSTPIYKIENNECVLR